MAADEIPHVLQLGTARRLPGGRILISLDLGGRRQDVVAEPRVAATLVSYLAGALAAPAPS
jgi:hypothetical protein